MIGFIQFFFLFFFLNSVLSHTTGFQSKQSVREKMFLYDIVANGRNGIDVDKYV